MEDIQCGTQKLRVLLNLYFSQYNKSGRGGNLSQIEKESGVTPGNPSIRALFKLLIKEEALIFDETILGVNFYYINRKMLQKLIDEQDLLKLHVKYLDTIGFVWT